MKKTKEKVQGRALAITCMILMIAVALPVGSCVSLSRERREAAEAYYGSEEVFGLTGDLTACRGEAANLVTLGEKYLPAGEELLFRVEEANAAVEETPTPRGKAAAFADLHDAVENLYTALEQRELSQQDEQYRVEIFADFEACADMMYRRAADYNADAEAFNAMFRKAPGRAVAETFGVRELELFE